MIEIMIDRFPTQLSVHGDGIADSEVSKQCTEGSTCRNGNNAKEEDAPCNQQSISSVPHR